MIGTPKPTASLSSNLLARKGQARPAMRPQGFVGLSPTSAQDDLGWNDMGEDVPRPAPAPIQLSQSAPKPMVLRQREELGEQIAVPQPVVAPEPVLEPAAVETESPLAVRAPKAKAAKPVVEAKSVPARAATKVVREVSARKAKAAFTLRLDQERHLRLRLASAVTNRSAQLLVTEALDAFLESLTDVDALARQVATKDHG